MPLLHQAVSVYNTYFFPNGAPNPNYPDPGDTQGYGYINNVGTSNTEEWSAILAFNSLIDPNPANRITYAQDARNLLMYAMNQAAQGHLAGAPFRDPLFAVYNRANGSGEEWPLTVDWIYNAVGRSGQPDPDGKRQGDDPQRLPDVGQRLPQRLHHRRRPSVADRRHQQHAAAAGRQAVSHGLEQLLSRAMRGC